jgi:2'-5' RNA ligase
VLWLGVSDGVEALGALSRRLGDGLLAAGWDGDDRPFRPHLTLARSDGIPAGAATAAALVAASRGFATDWLADRIVLFESHTGGGPARYEALREVTLGA